MKDNTTAAETTNSQSNQVKIIKKASLAPIKIIVSKPLQTAKQALQAYESGSASPEMLSGQEGVATASQIKTEQSSGRQ